AQGMCMSWPGHIKDLGGIRNQFHHVIDIVPTILEVTGITAPNTINGIKQRPIEGVSMVYTWDKANANAPTKHTTQYFEMLGNRAIYHDGWIAATTPVTIPWDLSTKQPPDVITGYKWELYNLNEDVTEGGRFGGYGLFLSKGDLGFGRGHVVFLYNLLDLKRTMWEGPELKPGKHTIRFVFKYSGPGFGKGGTGELFVDNQSVAKKTM